MGNPFAAPPAPDTDEVNALLDAARVPFAVSAAAVALAAAGLVEALLGLQNLTLVTWVGGWSFLPWLLLVAGAAGIAVAARLMHARRGSLAAGLGAAVVLALGAIGFFVVASLSGVFTPLALLGIGGGITALVLVLLAVRPFGRLAETRRRLRAAGYDLDL